MIRSRCGVPKAARWGLLLALLALAAGAAHADEAADHPVQQPEAAEADDSARKAEVLGSSRWRRAMHELDEWLVAQPVYSPRRVLEIKANLAARVAGMSSYELDYLLDGLDQKLKILDRPRAVEAREWLGRYLAVMADERRADLLADVPDVLALSPTELSEKLAEVEARRAKVERDARIARTSRREYAAFVDESRRAESADRDRITTTRRGDVVFSPYRTPAVDPPPFPDAFDSPTVVGVGPWGSFVDICLPGF